MNPTLLRLRQPLLYLTGVFFLYFSNGSHGWAMAAWVALPCFLLITRTLRPWTVYGLMAVTWGIVTQLSLWHFAVQDATQPFGTMGTLLYSQLDFLALAQLASVTGIWGITFMITWFDSVAAYAPVASANGNRVSRVVWFYAGVWLVVVAFGSWRLAQPPLTGTVRVAGIHVYNHQKMEQLWQSYSTN